MTNKPLAHDPRSNGCNTHGELVAINSARYHGGACRQNQIALDRRKQVG